mmetsp:Transcript_36439/g.104806  ORF Transcript_36439/g.104806 Transcript_36439/m.104806 type:complete len:428 (+) Transcript_36439:140-1423(+)
MGGTICTCRSDEETITQETCEVDQWAVFAEVAAQSAATPAKHKEGEECDASAAEGDASRPTKEDAAQEDSEKKKGMRLAFDDIQEGDHDANDPEAQRKKKDFMNKSGAATTSFKKCPTFIDPNRGLRNTQSVLGMAGNVVDGYDVLEKLGEGGFGAVFRVRKRDTSELLALKSIPRENVGDEELFERELEISRKLNHPYIIRLHETYNDTQAYHLVMDLCTGGDFHRYILDSCVSFAGRNRGGLQASEVGKYVWMMLNGIAYMHNYRFAHRDIKPENYLIVDKGARSGIKLIDFGLGRSYNKGEKMKSRVGTIAYVAPEVMTSHEGYDEKCDLWSIGVVVYVMACAEMPFIGKSDSETLDQAKKGKVDFKGQDWARQPEEVRDLVMELLTMAPGQRPSARDLLMSNLWVQKHAAGAKQEGGPCCAVQ